MQQYSSRTMPVGVSRKFLEHNNHQIPAYSTSPQSSYSSSSSSSSTRSISPEPMLSGHSLYRQPTFSYIPIHKRRHSGSRSLTLSHSMSFNSSMSASSQSSSLSTTTSSVQTPESEIPTTPTSLFSNSDHSMEYTSFPNLEKFSDECWTEVRVEKRDNISDMEMEHYDEMFVAGVCFQYS